MIFKDDNFLKDTQEDLQLKTEKSFKTKAILEQFALSILNHIKDLYTERDIFQNNDYDDEESDDDDLDF